MRAPCTPSCPLQGRLPIRVELKALTQEDFYRILTEPEYNLIKQQQVSPEGTFSKGAHGVQHHAGRNRTLIPACWCMPALSQGRTQIRASTSSHNVYCTLYTDIASIPRMEGFKEW